MILMRSIITIFLMFLIACNGEGKGQKKHVTLNSTPTKNPRSEPALYPTSTMEEELRDFPEINSILKQNPCIDALNCETEVVKAGESNLKNEQILILENINYAESNFHRYRDRVSGYYIRTENGSYQRVYPEAQVSKPFLEIVAILNRYPGQISKKIPSLGRYLYQHSQVKILTEDLNRIDHAVTVFELAIDRNPDTNFIFADNPNLSMEDLCFITKDEDEGFFNFSQKLDNALIDLTKIIQTNHIKYINMSFAPSIEGTMKHMSSLCGSSDVRKAKKIVDLYNQFYQRLLEKNANIILVQSVPNDVQGEFECPFDRRWIRVGYVNFLNSNIPKEGIAMSESNLPVNLKKISDCITTAVNGGVTDRTHFNSDLPEAFNDSSLFYNYYGLFAYPVDIMSTSWAAPLALSYLRAHDKDKNISEIYLEVQSRVIDPIKNKQFTESR